MLKAKATAEAKAAAYREAAMRRGGQRRRRQRRELLMQTIARNVFKDSFANTIIGDCDFQYASAARI